MDAITLIILTIVTFVAYAAGYWQARKDKEDENYMDRPNQDFYARWRH